MSPLILSLLAASLLFPLRGLAADCEGPPVQAVRLSPLILQEFFAGQGKSDRLHLVLSVKKCWNLTRLRIEDYRGRQAAELLIDSHWRGTADDPMLVEGPADSIQRTWHADLEKRNLPLRWFVDFSILSLGGGLESENFGDAQGRFLVVRGRPTRVAGYYQTWSKSLPLGADIGAPTLTYDELIVGLKNKSMQIFEIGKHTEGRWKLPQSVFLDWAQVNGATQPPSLRDFMADLFASAQEIKKSAGTKKIVAATDPVGFLLMSEIAGALKLGTVFWFRDPISQWNLSRGREDLLKGEKIVDGEEVLRAIANPKVKIIDLRSRGGAEMRIPSSVNAGFEHIQGRNLPPSKTKKIDPDNWYNLLRLDLKSLKVEKVIVYSHDRDSWSRGLLKIFKREAEKAGIREVSFYRDGWVDWAARCDWLSETGYRSEAATPGN